MGITLIRGESDQRVVNHAGWGVAEVLQHEAKSV